MSISPVKVHKISEEKYPNLTNYGFTKCKSCGSGVQGLKIALGLGYIESLSLRKNFHYTNFEFFRPCYESLKTRNHLIDVLNIIFRIQDGSIDHEEIVKTAKASTDLLYNIIEFSEFIFNINNDLQTINEILFAPEFDRALSELNVQLLFFSDNGHLLDKKKNYFIHPIVIPILIKYEHDIFNLYHQNYNIIHPNHFNTSLEVGLVGKCPSLANELEAIASLIVNNTKDSENLEVANIIEPIKNINPSLFYN